MVLVVCGYPPVLSLLCNNGGQGGVPRRGVVGTMGLYGGAIGGGGPIEGGLGVGWGRMEGSGSDGTP